MAGKEVDIAADYDDHNFDLTSVKQSLQNHDSQSKTQFDCYKMDYTQPKSAIIINNKTFSEKTKLKMRSGTDYDCAKIYSLLSEKLGFETVDYHHDCTVLKMKDILRKASEEDFSDISCFVCVILTYGHEEVVNGTDDRIEVQQLIQYFKGCKSLAGKPKIFIIQSCPYEYVDKPDGIYGDEEGDDDYSAVRKIPVEADILVVQSCVPGSLVWTEDIKKPSIFIDSLDAAFIEWKDSDIMTIMTRTSCKIVGKLSELKKTSFQPPYVTSTLTRELCFPVE